MDALPLITTGREMQQVPEMIWMWWLKDKYMSMPVTEPQVAQCHIHITELFQHSDYMQKCSNLYNANVVLHHCSLPGCTKWCILISSKKSYHLLYFLCRTKQTTHYLVKKEKPLPIIGPIPSQLNPKSMYATMIKWQSQHRKYLHQQRMNQCHWFAAVYMRCDQTVQGLILLQEYKYMITILNKWQRSQILLTSICLVMKEVHFLHM